jgi:hypothetical protein
MIRFSIAALLMEMEVRKFWLLLSLRKKQDLVVLRGIKEIDQII